MLCEEFIRAKAAAMAPSRQFKLGKKPRGRGGGGDDKAALGGVTRRDRSLSWEDLTPLFPPPSPSSPPQPQQQRRREPGRGAGTNTWRRPLGSRSSTPASRPGVAWHRAPQPTAGDESTTGMAKRRSLKHGSREYAGPGKSSSPSIVIPHQRLDAANVGGAAARCVSPTSFSLRYDDIHVGSVEPARPTVPPPTTAEATRDKAGSRHDAGTRPKSFHGGKDVPGDSLLLMTHPGSNSAVHSESLLNNYLRKKMEEIEHAMLLSPGRSPQSLMARLQHLSLYNTEQPSLVATGLESHGRIGEEVSSSVLSTPVLQISEENSQDRVARLHGARFALPPCAREGALRSAAPSPLPPALSVCAGGCMDSHCRIEEDPMGDFLLSLSLTESQRLKSDSISKMLQRSVSMPSLPALAAGPAGSASTLELYDQPTLAMLQRCRSATEYLQQFTSWDRDAAAAINANGDARGDGDGAPCRSGGPGGHFSTFSGELGSHDLRISYGCDGGAVTAPAGGGRAAPADASSGGSGLAGGGEGRGRSSNVFI
ncbi:uncharacterized protein LOC144734105 [Lampetra planeri]